jgi:4-hydroxy-tetrahydrodipicolinate synthase
MKKKLSAIVICLTPFAADGTLDEAAFRRQLGRLRDAGVSVYVAGSGSGEAYSLTPDERDRVMAIAVEELKGRVPVRAMGCEPRLIADMVDFMRAAERANVDAAQIFSLDIGHGSKPTTPELERYYSTVIESTSLPVYLSSHRAAGYVIPLDLIESLVKRYPTIRGVAYAGPDIGYLGELIARVGDRIEVHSAGGGNALTVLGLGGNGFMGGEGNFAPTLFASVISSWEAGDYDRLRSSFGKMIALIAINNKYGGSAMRALKPLMNAFGLPGGTLRPPRMPISDGDLDAVVKAVLKLEIPDLPPLVRR